MATDLHEAARRGDVAALRRLLDGGAAIEAEDDFVETPLHDAARNGKTECVALLLDRGAAIEAKANDICWTRLHWAACFGQTECAALLLDRGAAIEAKSISGRTALDFATFTSNDYGVALVSELGMTSSSDAALLTERDLEGIGMKPLERRKLLASASTSPAPAYAASPALRPRAPKVALCIGISAYAGCSPLLNAAKDAADVAAALRSVGYDVTHLSDAQASYKGIRAALDAFAAALRPGGVALFFFSGHGMRGRDGHNYLLPCEGVSHYGDLATDALSLERVNARLEGSACLLHVVISDACRSDPPPMVSDSKSELPRGFRVLAVPPAQAGSVMSYSCDPGEVSWDGARGGARNGAFTAALLAHLTTPELHVETLSTRVASDCQALTRHHEKPQRPWKSANLTHEHVCLF